jgi:hypothetical protein
MIMITIIANLLSSKLTIRIETNWFSRKAKAEIRAGASKRKR